MKKHIFTDRDAERIKLTGKLAEYRVRHTKNLFLRVTPSGGKSWNLLYRPAPKQRRKISLGAYPDVNLKMAKAKAEDLRAGVRNGVDPLGPIETASGGTLRVLTERYLTHHRAENSRDGKREERWTIETRRILDKDVLPHLGDRDIGAITKADIVAVLDRISERGARVQRDYTLGALKHFWQWAIRTGKADVDPSGSLGKVAKKGKRERVLTGDGIRTLWQALTDTPRMSVELRDVFRLQLILGMRVGEVIQAPKDEIDLSKRLWSIPKLRMKADRPHVLPLSDIAIDILTVAIERAGKSPWLFPAPEDPSRPMLVPTASRGFMRLAARNGLNGASSHDLRRTAATGMGDLGVSDDVIGKVLAHTPKTITAGVYNRSDRFPEMKVALDRWAKRLTEIVG